MVLLIWWSELLKAGMDSSFRPDQFSVNGVECTLQI